MPYLTAILRVSAIAIIPVLIIGCAGPRDPTQIECNLWQKICYRGHVPDRMATRQRFGVQGIKAIESKQRGNR